MSESSATESFADRLVVQRLVAPGVLDRRALQRTHDQFSQAAGAHDLARLHRRIESTSPSTGTLLLARGDRLVAPDDAAPLAGSPNAPITMGGDAPVSAVSRGAPSALVGNLVARTTPGMTSASTAVARRVADSHGLADTSRTTARLFARSEGAHALPSAGSSPVAVSAAPASVVQRVADHTVGAGRVSAPGEPVAAMHDASATSVIPSPASLSRVNADLRASSTRDLQLPIGTTPTAMRSSSAVETANPSVPLSATMPVARHASPTSAIGGSMPLLVQRATAATRSSGVSAPGGVTILPSTTAVAPSQLVLRKPDAVAAPAVQSTTPSASAQPAVARGDRAAASGAESAPNAGAWSQANERSIDWIAEQVGQRLVRRLEIERERMGVRQWRQVS